MIKSMTGFASLTRDDERGTIGVTIRAVNHRFLDLQLRLPPAIADLEPRLRALVQKRLARGRVELSVSLQLRQAPAPQRRAERGVRAGAGRPRWSRRASRGLVAGDADAGRSAAAAAGADASASGWPKPSGVSAMLGAAVDDAVVERRSTSSRRCACAKARTCAADLDARKALLAGLIDAHRRGRRHRARASWKRGCSSASRELRGGAADRSGGAGAGGRARRAAVGHHRRGDAVPRPPRALGRARPTAPSRAAASSISCCRR